MTRFPKITFILLGMSLAPSLAFPSPHKAVKVSVAERASVLNKSIGACACKIDPSARAAAKKPLGRTTLKDFKGRVFSASVVNDEYLLSLFQEMTVQQKIPFGFPEDGCFARAHEMAYQLDRKGILTAKVVASGKFRIDSEKAEDGTVTWSFHIAPAIVVASGKEKGIWVIDPSLFQEPASLEAWLKALTAHPKSKLTSTYLTNRFVYHPASRDRDLEKFADSDLSSARKIMKRYLKRESLRDRKNTPDL